MPSGEGPTSPAGRLSPESLSRNRRQSAEGAPLRRPDLELRPRAGPPGFFPFRATGAGRGGAGPSPRAPRLPAGGDPGGTGRGVHVRTGGGRAGSLLLGSQTPAAAPRGRCRASGATREAPPPGPGTNELATKAGPRQRPRPLGGARPGLFKSSSRGRGAARRAAGPRSLGTAERGRALRAAATPPCSSAAAAACCWRWRAHCLPAYWCSRPTRRRPRCPLNAVGARCAAWRAPRGWPRPLDWRRRRRRRPGRPSARCTVCPSTSACSPALAETWAHLPGAPPAPLTVLRGPWPSRWPHATSSSR